MSASFCVRIPPVAPAHVDVELTDNVEHLIRTSLFNNGGWDHFDQSEALSSTDEGMTGGQLLQAKGTSRTWLDGALAALKGEDRDSLTAFLAELDKHGSLLLTLER